MYQLFLILLIVVLMFIGAVTANKSDVECEGFKVLDGVKIPILKQRDDNLEPPVSLKKIM